MSRCRNRGGVWPEKAIESDEKKESIDKNEKKGRLFLASIVASSASLSDIDLSLSLSHET